MSRTAVLEPAPVSAPTTSEAMEAVIVPRARDIGAFEVRRALPSSQRQMVGPFIFFDQMGPAILSDGQGLDVRPHPHIGLATVTYLYEGCIFHRDSLGNAVEILPGAVNWMVAGKGITHSERTPIQRRKAGERIFGIQTWVALPKAAEETNPSFEHVDVRQLPFLEGEGKEVRVILGTLYGETAPVKTFSETFYADAALEAGANISLPGEYEERGIYISQGNIEIAGENYAAGRLLVLRPSEAVTIKALQPSRLLLLGGEAMDGPRYIWWNFVASSREKMEAAKRDWAAADWESGRFRLPPGDCEEFIPLPES